MMTLKQDIRFIRNMLFGISFVGLIVVLRTLNSILVPLALAGLLVLVNLPMIIYLEERKWPRWIIVPLIAIITIIIVVIVGGIFIDTFQNLASQFDFILNQLEKKMLSLFEFARNMTDWNISDDTFTSWLTGYFNLDFLSNIVGSFASGIGSFSKAFFMFALYYIILLSGVSGYQAYIDYVANGNSTIIETYAVMQQTISTYVSLKTVISAVTGLITGLICTLFGLKFAVFWGFTAFILNFIPSIGSIIAALLPPIMAIVQFDTFKPVIGIFVLLAITQFTIGNLIDPKIIGNRLRLNTITVIFGLVFWGYVWGPAGMLMSVPIMVILKLFLERSESMRIIARIMGNPAHRSAPPSSRGKKTDTNQKSEDEQNQKEDSESL